jgi:hypothetical protein
MKCLLSEVLANISSLFTLQIQDPTSKNDMTMTKTTASHLPCIAGGLPQLTSPSQIRIPRAAAGVPAFSSRLSGAITVPADRSLSTSSTFTLARSCCKEWQNVSIISINALRRPERPELAAGRRRPPISQRQVCPSRNCASVSNSGRVADLHLGWRLHDEIHLQNRPRASSMGP